MGHCEGEAGGLVGAGLFVVGIPPGLRVEVLVGPNRPLLATGHPPLLEALTHVQSVFLLKSVKSATYHVNSARRHRASSQLQWGPSL